MARRKRKSFFPSPLFPSLSLSLRLFSFHQLISPLVIQGKRKIIFIGASRQGILLARKRKENQETFHSLAQEISQLSKVKHSDHHLFNCKMRETRTHRKRKIFCELHTIIMSRAQRMSCMSSSIDVEH